jgi:hypothetical protein
MSESAASQAVATLQRLASDVDGGALLAAVAAHLMIVPTETYSETTHGDVILRMELLAYHLYPHFRSTGCRAPTAEDVTTCDAAVDVLFSLPADIDSDGVGGIIRDIRVQAEVIRGSAFPDQLAAMIREVQGTRDAWFARRRSIGPRRAVEIVEEILRAHIDASQEMWLAASSHADANLERYGAKPPRPRWAGVTNTVGTDWTHAYSEHLTAIAPGRLPIAAADLVLDPPLDVHEWDALVGMIGLTPSTRADIVRPPDMRRRPLFVLPDGRVILCDVANSLDNLWEAFETEARGDQKFYQQYQANRAAYLERETLRALLRLFPASSVYSGVTYPDPDGGPGTTAELDILVVWEPFLVLVEAKGGQFRLDGRLSGGGRLRSDLKATVGNAADQLDRVSRYVRSTDRPTFREARTGRTCSFHTSRMRRTYALAVTQQELGIGARVSELRDLGLFREALPPVTMAAFSLDTITRFCSGPVVFLHYLERRVAIQRGPPAVVVPDELNLFGAYLDDRLRLLDELSAAAGSEPVTFAWTAMSERFDDEASHRMWGSPEGAPIQLDLPPGISELLADLRTNQDVGARRIAFELLDLPRRELLAVASSLHGLRNTPRPQAGVLRTAIEMEGETLIVLVGAVDLSPESLRHALAQRALRHHYRQGSARVIGLGVDLRSPRNSVTATLWCGERLVSDPDLDLHAQEITPVQPACGWRPPGRNAPCWCGSGRKYKRCCLPRLHPPPS